MSGDKLVSLIERATPGNLTLSGLRGKLSLDGSHFFPVHNLYSEDAGKSETVASVYYVEADHSHHFTDAKLLALGWNIAKFLATDEGLLAIAKVIAPSAFSRTKGAEGALRYNDREPTRQKALEKAKKIRDILVSPPYGI